MKELTDKQKLIIAYMEGKDRWIWPTEVAVAISYGEMRLNWFCSQPMKSLVKKGYLISNGYGGYKLKNTTNNDR
jgi:hypothetical protein